MPTPVVSTASTVWTGDLFHGAGRTSLDSSGLATFDVGWKSRSEGHEGQTTPEELIAAAHASCYAMAFSNELASNGTPPTQLDTKAAVTFVAGEGITGIALSVRGQVPGISAEDFARIADAAKAGCPVSKALAAVPITLDAALA
ncbi:OsmC family protein [Beutenbergia cavernae DSM 12333]|uniref:OsmC family protein n=1 Tax=Beutenbergia cavernae (strain ATCC BAA-8 / DSM 12333 / CCUG 43141 / JCM 11478 / NBRC 16432 / NCIMB 13614 / HKI 0122) TaxID=471853 RepID=C5BV50_BEUC1|nr:OsmC family protein [Beutenbergia cavernae]ACQ80437.1 OsmC family protein [Beutenbergia cavernae DSM 12333]